MAGRPIAEVEPLIAKRLIQTGKAIVKAREATDAASTRMDEDIAYAHAHDVIPNRIAVLLGVTRTTVYKSLARQGL